MTLGLEWTMVRKFLVMLNFLVKKEYLDFIRFIRNKSTSTKDLKVPVITFLYSYNDEITLHIAVVSEIAIDSEFPAVQIRKLIQKASLEIERQV